MEAQCAYIHTLCRIEHTGMTLVTSTSLRGVLNGSFESNRAFISSGLGRNASGVGEQTWNWRMVVQRVPLPRGIGRGFWDGNGTALLK